MLFLSIYYYRVQENLMVVRQFYFFYRNIKDFYNQTIIIDIKNIF